MTSLLEEVANAPEPEPATDDEVWGQAVLEGLDDKSEDPGEGKPARRTRRPRKPKVDPETGEPVPPTTRAPRGAKLKEELLEPFVSLATDVATFAPTVSGVLIVRAERTVDGMVDLATGHKRTMAALQKVAKVSKGTDVLETVLLVLVAAAVDVGRIPLGSPLLDNIGHVEIQRDDHGKARRDGDGKLIKNKITIREIYNKTHGDDEQSAPPGPPPMPEFEQITETGAPMRFVPMNNRFEEPRG